MNKTPYKSERFDLLSLENNKVKNKYFPFNEDFKSWYLSSYPFYNFDEKLHYINFLEGKIFEIDNQEIKLKYKIDFGERLIPVDYTYNKKSFNKHEDKYAYLIGDFLEICDYLQFTYAYGKDVKTCLFAKNDGKVYHITNSGEWFKRIPPLFINTSYAKENYLASAFSNSDCLVLKKFADELQDKKLMAIVKKMDVMSNPMFVIYYLK
jgi:hypothetical protein